MPLIAERVRQYELMMLISPEATEDEVTATVEKVHGAITERGGTVGDNKVLGLRRLAYPINKFGEGNYALTRFELDAAQVPAFEGSLNASADIMRYMVTKL